MIINVRGYSNKSGIIISYLVENEEKTGYDSFNAKKIIVKNKIDILAAIKKTLISSRKLPEINASDFISTITKVGRKNIFDTSLKTIVKSVNDESMQSTMSTLSHVYFNNKPLPQIKAINIINGNMYFMIKVGSSYNLELIKSEKIKCVIVISSLVNMYRRIKQGTVLSKSSFKKHCMPSIPRSRPRPSETLRNTCHSWNVNYSNEDSPAEPILEESVSPSTVEIIPSANNSTRYGRPALYTYPEGISTRLTRRQVEDLANMNRIAITDLPQPESSDQDQNEEERLTGINLTAAEECFDDLEIQAPETNLTNTDREETGAERTAREAEVAVSVAEALGADEGEENRPVETGSTEREAEEVPAIRTAVTETKGRYFSEAERQHEGLVIRPLEANVINTNGEEGIENIRISETLAERLANALDTDEADEEEPVINRTMNTPVRQATPRQAMPAYVRQTVATERPGQIRNSSVEYLRENDITNNSY